MVLKIRKFKGLQMSRVDARVHHKLLVEARKYLKNVKPVVGDVISDGKTGGIVLTQDHIMEWLEIFAEDRIMLDGCNHATVKR